MTPEEAVADIRERAKTDHDALLRLLDVLLDGKRDSMRQSAAMIKRRRGDRVQGYAKAYETAAEHIEEALFEAFGLWPDTDTSPTNEEQVQQLRDEVARLTRERDLAVAHDTQPYPTADAYEQACKALETHRRRGDQAEAERDRAQAELARLRNTITRAEPDEVGDVPTELVDVAYDAWSTWGTGHMHRDMPHIVAAVLSAYRVLADLGADGKSEVERLKAAEQRVREIERTDRGFIRADDPETTQWMLGWDEAIDTVKKTLDGGEALDGQPMAARTARSKAPCSCCGNLRALRIDGTVMLHNATDTSRGKTAPRRACPGSLNPPATAAPQEHGVHRKALADVERLVQALEQARLLEQRARDLAHHRATNGNTATLAQIAGSDLATPEGSQA
ncbi:MAG: hypothetical protein JWP40_3983 [Blastococcus sp.]|nr:hypothetical protein [Blastococcus sp.]